jgi:NCAIR mutase (PurE)-related protein
MDSHELSQLLEGVRAGRIPTADAVQRLRTVPYEDTGFAKVDLHRGLRCGFPEVIFGQGKTAEQIEGILQTLLRHEQGGLVTRVDPSTVAHLRRVFPAGEHNPMGRTFRIRAPQDPGPKLGKVVVVTAGTSDLPVAEEARVTAEAWNCSVTLVADVGVAGLHRLLHQLHTLGGADAIVVVAGMEGALPSVVGGLVDCPVIAVPTSIGYGASFGGLAALLGMLNSCASNVVVVNIDAGFNGGHVAGLIARRAAQSRPPGTGPAIPIPATSASGDTHGA